MNDLNALALLLPLKHRMVCCFFYPLFHPVLHQTVEFLLSSGVNPLICVSPRRTQPPFFFPIPSFLLELASSFRSEWYLMCKEERQ